MKSIAYTTTALAFAGALAVAHQASADEQMQVSGNTIGTRVEKYFVPARVTPLTDSLSTNGSPP